MSRPARDPRALGFDSRVDENDASALPLSERNVARLFERQVQRTPHAPAVAFEKERLSYCELDARSNRLARALRGLGVGPGVPVGICMERSLETPLGVLAVLKAGGAYVALDPEYPRERLEFMLEDTRAPIVLTDERAERRVPRHDGQTIVLGSKSARAMLAAREETPLFGGARPEDLAYVIYTSGSTGRSKGVAMCPPVLNTSAPRKSRLRATRRPRCPGRATRSGPSAASPRSPVRCCATWPSARPDASSHPLPSLPLLPPSLASLPSLSSRSCSSWAVTHRRRSAPRNHVSIMQYLERRGLTRAPMRLPTCA